MDNCMSKNISNIIINENETIKNSIKKLNSSGKKILIVVDTKGKLLGTLSDGDIRKSIIKVFNLDTKIKKLYQKNSYYLFENSFSISKVKKIFIEKDISLIPIVNKDKIIVDYVSIDTLINTKKENNIYGNKLVVVIMAGGVGSRLKPFTNFLPKALLPFNNKTIIDNIISNLENYSINNIRISINQNNKVVKAYLDDIYRKSNFTIKYIYEKKPLGTIGSIKLLKDKKIKDILVINCDIVSFFDLNAFISFHNKEKNDISFIVSQKKISNPYGICKKNKNNQFIRIIEKPVTNNLINVGIYLLNSKITKMIPNNQSYNVTDLINKAKEKNKKIGFFPISDDCWADVGQWNHYEEFLMNNEN